MALGFGGKRKGKGAPIGNKNAAGKRGPSKAGKVLKGTAKAAAFGGAGYVAYGAGKAVGTDEGTQIGITQGAIAGYTRGNNEASMGDVIANSAISRQGTSSLAYNVEKAMISKNQKVYDDAIKVAQQGRPTNLALDAINGLSSFKGNKY